ncbi:multifunctional CCA addition/repair protein [Thalassotalea sp. PLHSN55]|uniref:multifunctional CCA addition/repair protein n=1 Tax=Thalassotalea sp. PLHSN55 TaxID=3435888 RepID=UPI003F82424C
MSEHSSQNNHPYQDNIFLVGGAVRDGLLNLAIKDKDHLVVGLTAEQMLDAGYTPVGKDFPVFLHPKTKEEYALARTEKKQGQGYTGFVCYSSPDVTIEQDLKRRDLTINAMARAADGTLIDPYQGQQDLNNRILRHVSDAFIEDPLRVLRVARFAARFHHLGFSIADETLALMSTISASGELNALSAERIWQEFHRSLGQDNPQVFFQVLKKCGALKAIWPELDKLWGIPNPKLWHPEICSGIHTMMVLEQAAKLSDKTTIRFAALCHDLGKSLTPEHAWPSHHGHEKSGLPLVEKICAQLKVPTDHKKLALKVCEFHLHSHKAFQLKAKTLLKVLNQLDVWRNPSVFDEFLLACQADFLGRTGFEHKPYPQAKFLQAIVTSATSVTAKQFVEQGLKGLAIKEAMEGARLNAIKAVIKQFAQ